MTTPPPPPTHTHKKHDLDFNFEQYYNRKLFYNFF